MNEHGHFARFKSAHRMALAVAREQITASNGSGAAKSKMQDTLHLPWKLPLWVRARLYLKKGWEPVVVNNKIDSVTMPKWIASSILGAVLLFGVSSWWRASDQRDMLIELRTELKLAKEYDDERAKQIKEQAELNKVYIDNMTNQLNVIKGMLSLQQLNAVENVTKGKTN